MSSNQIPDVIRFYREGDSFGCFSNFSRHEIHLDGHRWPTTEHFFQAQKFVGTEYETKVRLAKGPGEAAQLGRNRAWPLRPNWEHVKDGIMHRALVAKFTQHDDLRCLLLETGDAKLVEHTENDRYWADGGDGTGKNMLGVLLMQVRRELRGAAAAAEGP